MGRVLSLSTLTILNTTRIRRSHHPSIHNFRLYLTREEYDHKQVEEPRSKLEKKITLVNAKRVVKFITEIKDILCVRVPIDDAPGLYSDEWSGSAGPVRDA